MQLNVYLKYRCICLSLYVYRILWYVYKACHDLRPKVNLIQNVSTANNNAVIKHALESFQFNSHHKKLIF
jgi:hypothetical protein